MPGARAVERADQALRGVESTGGQSKNPLGQTELRFQGCERLDAPLPQAVKIPPMAAVENKIKRAIWREQRLKPRFLAAPGDAARIDGEALRSHVPQPQFRA